MEEILDLIKNRLTSAIEFNVDENNLIILIIVKQKEQITGKIAEPKEVKDMLRMLGGLKEDIPMDIEINNDVGHIILKFTNKNDMEKVNGVLDKIWDRTINIFKELVKGNYDMIKDMGDFEE